jgi:predicted dehydrogenase
LIDPTSLHRLAASLDGEAAITILPRDGWQRLLESESSLPPDQRVDLVTSPEPAITKAFAAAGFNVLADVPAAANAEGAEDLLRTAKTSGSIIGVAHTPTGYPMVRRATELVREKKLGAIRKVIVEHNTSAAQASAMRDLVPAAENLLATVTGLKLRSLCADIVTNATRRTDDDATLLLRFEGQARGVISASQSSLVDDILSIRVLGTDASLAWRSNRHERLTYTPKDAPARTITRGGPDAGPLAAEASRLGTGQAEGAIEALANIYRGMYEAIRAKREGRARKGLGREFPSLQDAVRGARFMDAALESARGGGVWVDA